jgi:hypothetical protein
MKNIIIFLIFIFISCKTQQPVLLKESILNNSIKLVLETEKSELSDTALYKLRDIFTKNIVNSHDGTRVTRTYPLKDTILPHSFENGHWIIINPFNDLSKIKWYNVLLKKTQPQPPSFKESPLGEINWADSVHLIVKNNRLVIKASGKWIKEAYIFDNTILAKGYAVLPHKSYWGTRALKDTMIASIQSDEIVFKEGISNKLKSKIKSIYHTDASAIYKTNDSIYLWDDVDIILGKNLLSSYTISSYNKTHFFKTINTYKVNIIKKDAVIGDTYKKWTSIQKDDKSSPEYVNVWSSRFVNLMHTLPYPLHRSPNLIGYKKIPRTIVNFLIYWDPVNRVTLFKQTDALVYTCWNDIRWTTTGVNQLILEDYKQSIPLANAYKEWRLNITSGANIPDTLYKNIKKFNELWEMDKKSPNLISPVLDTTFWLVNRTIYAYISPLLKSKLKYSKPLEKVPFGSDKGWASFPNNCTKEFYEKNSKSWEWYLSLNLRKTLTQTSLKNCEIYSTTIVYQYLDNTLDETDIFSIKSKTFTMYGNFSKKTPPKKDEVFKFFKKRDLN